MISEGTVLIQRSSDGWLIITRIRESKGGISNLAKFQYALVVEK